jgi:hypothetical protein
MGSSASGTLVSEVDRMSVLVTVENFVRAETDRMFSVLHADAGGVNQVKQSRAPTPIED